MPAPRTSAPSITTGSDALLYLLFSILGIALAFGSLAWLTGNLTNTLVGVGPWVPFRATDTLLHPDVLWPHLSATALLVGARIVPGLLSVCLTIASLVLWLRLRGGAKNGLARKADLAPLLDKEITAKASSLRPSLSELKPNEVAPADRGILIGTLSPSRAEVRASWEDVIVAIMAPRSGKTSGLAIPAILAAPGPVLLTSNKAANDAFTATVDARAEVGTIWTLDPQQIAHHPREMWWDILADARDLAGAKRLAGHFVAASVDESHGSDSLLPATVAQSSAAAKSLAIATQLVQDGWEIHEGAPKTDSGIRLIALDDETDQLFLAHKASQQQERLEWGDGWVDTGRIFTQEDGSILHPGKVSDLFERLVEAAGLPPIRLHDLRHVAATLMLAAGVDIKVVSETLGHSDTRVTRDIYQAVLDDLARDAAEKVVQLVPRARKPLSVVKDSEAAAPNRTPRMTLPRKAKEPDEERSA
ncbi:tyrosine-type recombinase/integrase [Streptomyces sp. NPDC052236]|uniref:tyrosine-type recombinase/integrase n=1 Tax=Streptomyces sp. NPDC052236 TaxID=3365686 RepID=UPI0037D448DE